MGWCLTYRYLSRTPRHTWYLSGAYHGGFIGSRWVKTMIFSKKWSNKTTVNRAQLSNEYWANDNDMLPGSYPYRKYMVCMVWSIILWRYYLKVKVWPMRDGRTTNKQMELELLSCWNGRLSFAFWPITGDFDIKPLIEGTIMWNLRSRRFQKCGIYWVWDFSERKLLSLKVNYKKPLWTIVFYKG